MGYIYAIFAAITWGFVYAIDQKILDKVSPSLLMFINSVFTIAILLPLLYFSKFDFKSLFIDKSVIKFLVLSLIFTLIANLLIYFAIQNIGSSKAAIFEIAYPFFVILFSIFLFNIEINGYFIFGSVLIFIGSAIILKLS